MDLFTNELLISLHNNFAVIDKENSDECVKASLKAQLLSCSLIEQENYYYSKTRTQLEEINYFKSQRPQIESEYIFYTNVQKLYAEFPIGTKFQKKKYIKNQLERLYSFFINHQQLFSYLRSNFTHLDKVYFAESNLNKNFVSYYRAVLLLESHMNGLSAKFNTKVKECKSQSIYTWSGSKADLIELIYALQSCNCINGGKITIKSLVEFFEINFNVNLKDANRTFLDIKRRSKPVKFLSLLSEVLEKKIIEEDYIPFQKEKILFS